MSAGLIAREYLRVSYDKSGRQRSNEEQHEDNVDLGELLGFSEFGEPYLDLGSASVYRRRERNDFDQLRSDLKTGKFGADVLVVWEVSRLSREVGDWPAMLEDCKAAGVRIAVTAEAAIYNPAQPRDKKALYTGAVDAEYESAKVSLRTKRAMRSAARSGAPHGRIPFGYCRTYDPTGRIVQRPELTEARIVVELFERIAAGDTLAAIAKDFEARGIASRKGVPFAPQTLRGMALAPVYAGRRVHQPGDAARAHRGVEATTTDGTWERLVPDDVFYAVRLRLTDPSRRTVRPGRGIHLLSMLARCDVCGAKLTVTYRKGPRAYQCHGRGCVKVDAADLDAWAEEQIEGWFAHPDGPEHLYRDDDRGELLTAARGVVERTRAEHADLIAQVATGALSATLAAGAEPAILARLAEAEAAVAELTTPDGLDGLIRAGADVVEQWKAMTMPVRREIVRLLFSPARAGVLSVARVTDSADVDARVRLDGKPLRVI